MNACCNCVSNAWSVASKNQLLAALVEDGAHLAGQREVVAAVEPHTPERAFGLGGLLRAFETFASQRSWNSPDLVWAGIASLVDWICNVLLPVYAGLQVAAGGLQLAGVSNRFQPVSWMKHFAAAGLCLLVSGLLRLGEFFVTHGTGGVT